MGTKVYINDPGHMVKMAAMAINRKKPLQIFFSGTSRPMTLKLGMKHKCIEFYKVYTNLDAGLTLTQSMERSTSFGYALECENRENCHLMGKTCWELTNGQKICLLAHLSRRLTR